MVAFAGSSRSSQASQPSSFEARLPGVPARGGTVVASASGNVRPSLNRWLTFAGCVLVVAVLYWAKPLLVPIALAMLLTFVLTPPVTWLQRWIGRVPAVLAVVALVGILLAGAAYGVAMQLSQLAGELPLYRSNIRQKIADVRNAGRGGSVERIQETVEELQKELETTEKGRSKSPPAPVMVQSGQASTLWGFPAWLAPVLGPASTAGLVVVLVIFMLLEREELRGRLIGLLGHGNLAATTKAFDEAGRRVSRQLLMQTLVSAIYGACAGLGLWAIGVPYPLLWAALGAALRFVPYLGPIAAAAAPLFMSLAVFPGWYQPLWVLALFIGLELFTNLVLETVLYAGAAGVSQVALLVAVAGWTWLWGGMGLLLATPLTVCLVVLGKHVAGLEFVSTLIADSPPLPPDIGYYQRLLARDQGEAADFLARHLASNPPDSVYDALLVPALNYAEQDRLQGRLDAEDERLVLDATKELMVDAATLRQSALRAESGEPEVPAPSNDANAPEAPLRVVAYPAGGVADELALGMLQELLEGQPIALEIPSPHLLTSEVADLMRKHKTRVLCIADLPPSPPSKTRYVLRKLRAELPDATILVGRWAPALLADDDRSGLLEAGATHVAATLLETRDQLCRLVPHERHRAASDAA
jgi:predicted PurR-regulated permease PerM